MHSLSLASGRGPLLRNFFEAWDHGPVVRVLYHEFKQYGHEPIDGLAMYFDYELGARKFVDPAGLSPSTTQFLDQAIKPFIDFSADHLEKLTHENGSPWHLVYYSDRKTLRDRIPDELVAGYTSGRFSNLVENISMLS